MNYYLEVLKKFAVFSGRATRAEYWYFSLYSFLISLVFILLDRLLFSDRAIGILTLIYSLAIFIPSLSVFARRLHDTGKSAWMMLLFFVPLIGVIWLLVLMFIDSNPEENKYGPNPKNMTQDAVSSVNTIGNQNQVNPVPSMMPTQNQVVSANPIGSTSTQNTATPINPINNNQNL